MFILNFFLIKSIVAKTHQSFSQCIKKKPYPTKFSNVCFDVKSRCTRRCRGSTISREQPFRGFRWPTIVYVHEWLSVKHAKSIVDLQFFLFVFFNARLVGYVNNGNNETVVRHCSYTLLDLFFIDFVWVVRVKSVSARFLARD